MDGSSKQFKNWCDIWRTVFPKGKSSDNVNPSRFSFRMHRPVFELGPLTLKWSLLLLCSGIISSSLCFYFDHLWRIFLRTDNSWFYRSYSLDKYNRWTCALLDISTRAPPIISSIFLHIFGDMTSSIECECAVLLSRSDKEDICSHRIWVCFWISYGTYLITCNKLLLSATTMVEIFRPSQKRDLRGVVAVSVCEVNV